MKDKLLNRLEIEHLRGSEELEEIAECSGLDFVRELLSKYEGMKLYIPRLESNKRLVRDAVNAMRGKSAYQIARELGLSVRAVREVMLGLNEDD